MQPKILLLSIVALLIENTLAYHCVESFMYSRAQPPNLSYFVNEPISLVQNIYTDYQNIAIETYTCVIQSCLLYQLQSSTDKNSCADTSGYTLATDYSFGSLVDTAPRDPTITLTAGTTNTAGAGTFWFCSECLVV